MAYKIGKGCSTCHYCYNECPVHAIGFVGTEYAIDPETCIDCGVCAQVCPSGIIEPEEGREPAPRHDLLVKQCDVVVLGAGGAGLTAAVRTAEETGKRVIVLEKAPKPGGNTNLGHNFILRYSKLHEQAGLPDRREEFIQKLYEGPEGKLTEPLIREATYAITDFFNWIYDNSDLEKYIKLVSFGDMGMGPLSWGGDAFFDFPDRSYDNLKSTDHSMGPGWMGTYAVRHLMERCRELGVEVLCSHRAVELLTDGDRITGVLAEDPGGQTKIEAGCCLIASGGFARNREIVEKVRPSFYEGQAVHTFSVASNTGDAIGMVEKIGGALDFQRVKVPMMGPVHHPYHYGVVRMSGWPELVTVNSRGERFRDEGEMPHGLIGPLEDQPGKFAWAVGDNAIMETVGARIIEQTKDNPALHQGMLTWREQLEEECTYDKAAQKADTIEELAVKMGVPPQVLTEQIRQYNAYCRAGKDDQFGKKSEFLVPIENPPYYALYLIRFNEGAEGGVVNDDDLRVLKADGTPFRGLYAAGDCCRGLFKPTDDGGKFGEMAWAFASGYMAARKMASYLDSGK